MHISIVTPIYNCADCLPDLYQRLAAAIAKITEDFEIIMVNDASPDSAWDVIKELAAQDARVKGINLSRNFGQHYAITAGLDYARGDWVVVMDCDLQDQPEEIAKLYAEAMRGFDAVVGRRLKRQDPFIKRMCSRLFYRVFDYLTGQKSDATIANFGIYSRKVIENYRQMREQNRNFPLFIRWLGFSVSEIDIDHASRKTGKSSYNFRKMLNLAIDSIVSQSNKPLRIAIKLGFMFSAASFVYAAFLLVRYFVWAIPVAGWTSVMVSIYFIAGLMLANMGMLGLYIGKIFDEVKGRPLYIVKDTVGF